MLFCIISVILTFSLHPTFALALVQLPPELQQVFETRPSCNVLVTLKASVNSVIDSINSRRFPNSGAKTTTMVAELREFTAVSQRPILSLLHELHPVVRDVEGFWITNQILVRNARKDLLHALIEAMGLDIEDIQEDMPTQLDDPVEDEKVASSGYMESWGLANIHLEQAHQLGYTGQGIVVGVMDTGARGTHEALGGNMRKVYNWFDPRNFTETPTDDNGHGSHTTGTAVGLRNGVAPGATWIHCKFLNRTGSGTAQERTACAQWILCPTLPDGTMPDCSQKPHIVSNSWGSRSSDKSYFNDVINAWRAADIIPVFSIGNRGPDCRTATSPGDQPNLISVGATNAQNQPAKFSSRGPVKSHQLERQRMKPEISAPGYKILSASYTQDDTYRILSGTSMACPHVAGAIAVLLSKNPNVSFQQILDTLQSTAFRPPIVHNACHFGISDGQTPQSHYPNNVLGHGILRLDEALQAI